jgi:hypothetical protein
VSHLAAALPLNDQRPLGQFDQSQPAPVQLPRLSLQKQAPILNLDLQPQKPVQEAELNIKAKDFQPFRQAKEDQLFRQEPEVQQFRQAQEAQPFRQAQEAQPFRQEPEVQQFRQTQENPPFRQTQQQFTDTGPEVRLNERAQLLGFSPRLEQLGMRPENIL